MYQVQIIEILNILKTKKKKKDKQKGFSQPKVVSSETPVKVQLVETRQPSEHSNKFGNFPAMPSFVIWKFLMEVHTGVSEMNKCKLILVDGIWKFLQERYILE